LLVSVMMPFHPGFDEVYRRFARLFESAGLKCRRADDIWENPAVIQDVVSLIDRSRVVICDCTSRNANVFYEIGIAHTLGREVILITQAQADIPFDLRHLRYVSYLNNGESGRNSNDVSEPVWPTLWGCELGPMSVVPRVDLHNSRYLLAAHVRNVSGDKDSIARLPNDWCVSLFTLKRLGRWRNNSVVVKRMLSILPTRFP
jgi:hypothetical protein